MDAVEFLKEGRRMCDSFEGCEGCPGAENACCFNNDAVWCKNHEGVVAAVEQWSKDHPVKTRQSELLKQFPNADMQRINTLFPCVMDQTVRTARCIKYEGLGSSRKCVECRNDYWNEEVTDND